ncbi:MAG: alkaline phosphatase family protein [Chitinophagaceae bacterium]|nr:alkaline phosphatase family protein [Chitinophagaceae bacterium]
MRRIIIVVLLCFGFVISQAQKDIATTLPRPKLVVGIVIDQMRWDYLYRYYDRYGNGGFKRLLNEGFTCENTYIDYVPTVTAIGHSTIYTGSVPAIHGITGNDFIVNATGKTVYCTEDSTVQSVGSSSDEGKMSPRNLLASTITDELKLATNFRSKVIGISLKDRGSILPGGHTADAAYWFDNASGNWITSTYYMKELPAWVKQFNEQRLAEKYLNQDWNTLYDIKTYVQSSPDDNRYEGKFMGQTTSTFPVKTSSMFSKNFDIIRSTPYGNTITLDLAKAAIDKERLGQNAVTDFLAVSCSSTDYIGHKFGVNAIEVEDTYLRLDRDLASFFTYLDTKLGKGNYTVFLSADHGAAHNPNLLIDKNIPAGLWQSGQVQKDLNSFLESNYKIKNIVTSFSNSQVHFNYKEIEKNKLDEESIRKDCVNFLSNKPGVAFVVDAKNIAQSAVPELLKTRIINGYNTDRSGPVTIVLEPAWYSGAANATGTTHGSWNAYDAHIPLLWMGWGIKHGSSVKQTNMTDIAPTLAALLHIQEPNGCIGKPIAEVIKN